MCALNKELQMQTLPNAKSQGFTLIELMVTVAIIGILAAIALPNYSRYVIRSNRVAAQAEMMEIANRQQQFLLANRAYVNKSALEASGYRLPAEVSRNYTYTVTPTNTSSPPTFTITFSPTGGQTDDGIISLNSAGVKEPPEKW